ncbi:trypsin-like serine protease [Myxococcus sp. MISCRS1]|uniref:trypsin-like serine protease n=1 Tax=Myxococcus sp. MISCRS1 TaxID=2996786 RepID=UPI00226DDE04|nr:trypsin-like serine protease [Myxococcus sp. MISCRS1]MCY0995564.1 trypsin-like serine protease [Myxococcus sp. MISCRS1]
MGGPPFRTAPRGTCVLLSEDGRWRNPSACLHPGSRSPSARSRHRGLRREDDYDTSSILMQVRVPIVGDEALVSAYAQERILIAPVLMFGTGYPEGDRDSCQTVGPVVLVEEDGANVLHGLTSFSLGCGRPGLPGVYTCVSHYLTWLHARIRKLSDVQHR